MALSVMPTKFNLICNLCSSMNGYDSPNGVVKMSQLCIVSLNYCISSHPQKISRLDEHFLQCVHIAWQWSVEIDSALSAWQYRL